MSDKTETASEAGENAAAQVPEKKPRLIMSVLIAALVCGAAGAASYVLAPAALGPALEARSAAKPSAKAGAEKKGAAAAPAGKSKESHAAKPHEKKKEAGDGEIDGASAFFVTGATGVFTPRPIVVTLKPQGRIRYLKVALAIETTPESETAFVDNELRIIDILTSYLRAVPVAAIEDPAAMARIREQIARRISFIVDPAPVNAVLITDFILS